MRKSNAVAIGMYEKARLSANSKQCVRTRLRLLTRQRRRALQFGYTIYRQVLNYYSGEEDAYGAWAARQVHA